MTCNACGEKPKKCGNCNKDFPRAVIEINNPETLVLLRKVVIPASMGTEEQVPPAVGKYHNVILHYEANKHTYLYSSDGIPTLLEAEIPQEIINRIDTLEEDVDDLNDAIDDVEQEIEDLKNSPDVVDIVATYADLQAYDTSALGDKDVIRVLADETHDGASSYYRWDKPNTTWTFIGITGPYYTKTETDTLIDESKITWIGTETTSSSSGATAEITTTTGDFKWAEGHTVVVNFKYKAGRSVLNIDSTGAYNIDNVRSLAGGIDSGIAIQYVCAYVGGQRAYRPIGRLRASSDVAGPVLLADNLTTTTGVAALAAHQGVVLDSKISNILSVLSLKQNVLTAGSNIQISNDTISATDTTYSNFVGTDGTTVGTAGLVPAPAITDAGKFLKADGSWDTAGGSTINVVQTIGTSTTDVMSQKAVTDELFNSNDRGKVQIGNNASSTGGSYFESIAIGRNATASAQASTAIGSNNPVANAKYSLAIGYSTSATNDSATAIGNQAQATYKGSVGLGAYSKPLAVGEVNVGSTNTTYGYNSSNYRLLTGVYDPVNAHDAATKGYVDTAVAGVSTNTISSQDWSTLWQ